MAILDRFRSTPSSTGNKVTQSAPPFGNDPAQSTRMPMDTMLGHTPQAVDPGMVRPRVGALPFGASGRANFYGLPQWDELNPKLIGPRGCLVLDDMYRTDAHIRRLVLAAWSPVTAGTWTLEPYGGEDASDKDRKIADALWWLLSEWMAPNFTEHLYELGPVLLRTGFTPFEQINWQTVEYQGQRMYAPKSLSMRLPRTIWRWWQDDFGSLTHIGQILPNKADVVIPASELVYYRLAPEGDNWMGQSLLRHCYKNWYLKDKLERLDAIGQERKAVGMPALYHSPDVPADQLDAIEAALANMHISEVAYLMLPGYKMGMAPEESPGLQFLLDVIQFDSSAGTSINDSIDRHQMAISASFLTDFLELGHHQVGARATAEVQEDPFLTAVNGALLPPVIPPLNRFIDRLCKLNWDADGSPQLKLTLNDEASLSEIAAYVVPLIQAGAMQADPDLEDWLRDRAAMPAANAEVRAQKQAAQDAAYQNAAAAADGLATSGEQPGAEPPSPNADPAKPGVPAPAKPGQGKPGAAVETPKPRTSATGEKQLDASAPLSGGTGSAGGLQMVPEQLGGRKCTCEDDGDERCPVHDGKTLDMPSKTARKLGTAEPTVKWFERLLSQDRLREAFDGAREHVQAAAGPQALLLARQMAHQTANGGKPLPSADTQALLADALAAHYTGLYHLGRDTVATELAKQRAALARKLDEPIGEDLGAAGASRLSRARARGEHSARNIANRVSEVLGRRQITGLRDPAALTTLAEQTATGALRMEAVTNAAAQINDGRADEAQSVSDVVGAYYTAVLDASSCDPCSKADDGTLLSPEQALLMGPPNPDCDGADRCRCMLLWVLSDDPAALQAIT